VSTLLQTIATSSIDVQFKEQYASSALNKKFAVINPPGAYRGYALTTSASALSVDVAEDSVHGDHLAVYQTSDGFSLTIRDAASGTITLDISSFATQTVIIAISADYTVGTPTSGELRGFELSEYDALSTAERDELVVLGTVTVPGGGVIPAANITSDRRDFPWESRAAGSVPWNPALRNSGFEMGDPSGGTYKFAQPYWEVDSSTRMEAKRTDVESNSGVSSLEFATTSATSSQVLTLVQRVGVPVAAGKLIKVQLAKKVLVAAAVSNSAAIGVFFFTKAGVVSGGSPTLSFDITAVDAQFELLEAILEVPADAVYLSSVILTVDGDWAAPASVVRFDDVQVWIEGDAKEWLTADSPYGREVGTSAIMLAGPGLTGPDAGFAGSPAKLTYDGVNVVIEKRDQSGGGPGLVAEGGVTGGGVGAFSAISCTSLTATGIISTTDRVVVGSALGGSLSDAELARVSAAVSVFAGVEYTLVWESIPSSEKGYRKYISPTGDIVETINAAWDNTTNLWTKDVGADAAMKYTRSLAASTVNRRLATGLNTWLDTAWNQEAISHGFSPPIGSGSEDYSPLTVVREAGGRPGFVLDHNGLRDGRTLEFRENWMGANGVPAAGELPHWIQQLSAGSSVFIQEPFSTPFDRSCDIQSDNTIGAEAIMKTYALFSTFSDNQILTMEWSYFHGGATSTGHMMFGFVTDFGDETSDRIVFRKDAGVTDWSAQCFDGSGTVTVPTGVTHIHQQAFRMKIEVRGYDAIGNVAGEPRALFYIDDNLVADITTNVETTTWQAFFRVESSAASAPFVELGPVYIQWFQGILGNL
jgi:hypothetical protein